MMIIQTESFSIAHNMNFAFGERKQSAKRKKVVAIPSELWYVVLLQGGEAHEQTAGNTLPQPIHSAGAGRTSKGNQLLPPPADGAAGKVRTQIAAENGG